MSSASQGEQRLDMDERKLKRMISNRESARRSRGRKKQHLEELTLRAALMQNEKNWMLKQLSEMSRRYLRLELENVNLRNQVTELTTRLNSLESLLGFIAEESDGTTMDVSDPLLRP
ncbi:bZIP transcription factor 53-like [Canna indica]|uniref:BZIP transcription factor 53-like n=1 Tax=Canna indica TaxID=4628 RepID=A0AAQ3KVC8_9LILI|nr:bZIP transcription factor 53-like [Canna indica]